MGRIRIRLVRYRKDFEFERKVVLLNTTFFYLIDRMYLYSNLKKDEYEYKTI